MNNIIKIIDEHEINREAKIITYISLDGNDYAVYTISRDEENANIFVSKVINSSFVNITDANEKFKLDNFEHPWKTYPPITLTFPKDASTRLLQPWKAA